MTRLSDLNPRWSQCYARFTPKQGGIDPLPKVQLTFGCPKCGVQFGIAIYVSIDPASIEKHCWHVDTLPQSIAWTDDLTITPSIQCGPMQHGSRGPQCGAHITITKGEVILS